MVLKSKYYAIVQAGTDIARYNTPSGSRYISVLAQQEVEEDGFLARIFLVGADVHYLFEQSWNMDGDGTTEPVLNWVRGPQEDLVMYELSTTDRTQDGNGGNYAKIIRENHYPANTIP